METIRRLTEQEQAYIKFLENENPKLASEMSKLLRRNTYRENGKTIFKT
jgi:hypothetical protein